MTKKEKPKAGTLCGYCPNVIHLHQESEGLLHMKKGKPICARCRILTRSPLAAIIKADKTKFDQDIVDRRNREQERANREVEDVAVASQKLAGADSKKKRALMKRLHLK